MDRRYLHASLCGHEPRQLTAIVPIKQVATDELKLPTHAIDTFTGWTPPVPINLVVAVSFGLFVPPRILGLAKYGGINVHPSLLPDLSGAAPIQHAILRHRDRTGVSIQTLDPEHFDHGTILAQTPEPGIAIPRHTTTPLLESYLTSFGAQMLIDILKAQKYIQPHEDAGWYAASNGPVDHAPKLTKQDSFIDFSKHTLKDIMAKYYALGDVWCILPNGARLIMHQVSTTGALQPHDKFDVPQQRGIWVEGALRPLLFHAACGGVGVFHSSTYAGSPAGSGNQKVKHLLRAQ